MRQYKGISPGSLPPTNAPDFTSRLRSMLANIDNYLHDTTSGFSRVEVGQVPSGSGSPIPTTVIAPTTVDFSDALFRVSDNTDPTKKLAFEVSGINTASVATVTIPNASGTLPLLESAQVWSGANSLYSTARIVDATDPTKKLAFDLSGMATGTTKTITLDSALGLTFGPGFLGFNATFDLGYLTASRIFSLSDSDGFIVVDGSATFYSLNLSRTASILQCLSSTSGVAFANTTGTQRLRFVVSGSVGNNAISVANTAARTYTLGDDTSTLVGRVASSDQTGQTAAFADTTLYTTPHAGMYRISAYAVFTAVTTPGTLTVDATWTDPQATTTDQTFVTKAYTTAGDHNSGDLYVYATAASAIKWRTTFTGTATFSVYGRVETL